MIKEPEKPKIEFRPKVDLIYKQFPAFLKDPKNYEKIYKAILDAGATKHSHSDIAKFGTCRDCQSAMWRRKEMMKKLGFLTAAHWRVWNKIMAAMLGLQKKMPIQKNV
jgi:hypothetical protein